MPYDVTGIPSRAEMARTLLPGQVGITLAEAADSQDAVDPIQVCYECVNNASPPPNHFYQRIAWLAQKQPALTILTTAYDDRLEQHLQGVKQGYNRFVFDDHLGYRSPDQPNLYYLFGLARYSPESLVIRQKTHDELGHDPSRSELLGAARASMRQNTVLFIGYTFSDAEIRTLLPPKRAQTHSRPLYVYWPGILESERLRLINLGLTVLETLSWNTDEGEFSLDISWVPQIERGVPRQASIAATAVNPAEFDLNLLVDESARWINGCTDIVGLALAYQEEPLSQHYYKRLNDILLDGKAEIKSRQKIDARFTALTQKLSEVERRCLPYLASRPVILPLEFTKADQVIEFWEGLRAIIAEKPAVHRLIVIIHIQEEWQLPDDVCLLPRPRFHQSDVDEWIDTVQKAAKLPPDIVRSWKEVLVAECQDSPDSDLQICYVYDHIKEMIDKLSISGLDGLRSSLEEKRSVYCVSPCG